MNTVETIPVIRTALTRRGTGEDRTSPIRVITEYWTPEGDKIAEIDPAAWLITPERLKSIDALILQYNVPPALTNGLRELITKSATVSDL